MKLKFIAVSLIFTWLFSCGQEVDNTNETDAAKDKMPALALADNNQASLHSGLKLNNFDHTVRPQDDFYRHVNGRWLLKNKIPTDRSSYGIFTALADKAQEDIEAIVEESAAANSLLKSSDVQKVGDLYKSVLDTESLENLGVKPLEPYFAEIDAIKNKQQLAEYFAMVFKRGSDAPLAFFINIDAKNPTEYVLYLTQSGLGLPSKDYYFNEGLSYEAIRQKYVKHIETMFALAGLASGDQAAQDIMALEMAIANGHWNKEDNRNSVKTYNKYELSQLVEIAKDFDWISYFNALGVNNQKYLIVRQPTFVSAFNLVFVDTSLEAWKSYFKWHLLSGNAGLMNKELAQENFVFYGKVLEGTLEQPPRRARAVNAVNNLLGEVVGKVYVAKHFRPEAKARMMSLVENLKEAFRQSILALDWMSEETKEQAINKLNKFRPKIGYPEKWRDYSSLVIQPNDLLGNYMAAREFNFGLQLNKLGRSVDRDEWFMTPQTVNAYYNPVMNEIVFPAAILQPPVFDMNADDAVNYGGIGAIIGHEMGHAFDDQGASYDGDGVLREWWTETDKLEFKARTAALAAQYDEFEPLPGVFVNGKFTLGENIGDLGGLTIAYKAYQMSKGEKLAPVLSGFTGDQRFFIGWAQIWARKYRDEELKRRISVEPQSPSEYRTNGVLRNMSEFVEAFDVKEGDRLYLPPEKRVKIW